MKTILVPTDFSAASKIAARFAARVGKEIGNTRIILYNMFSGSVGGSDGSPVADGATCSRAIRMMALNNMSIEIQCSDYTVNIDYLAEEGHSLTECINRMVVNEKVDLVVMGASGATRLEQILVGSNTMRMVRHAICPVLVIPPHAVFNNFKRVVLTLEHGTSFDKVPVKSVEATLTMFPGELHIVYIEPHHTAPLTAEQLTEKAAIEKWLTDYHPIYHYLPQAGFLKTINQFADAEKVDLLLTVPHKVSYLNDLFHYTNIEQLGNRSHAPFVAIPEQLAVSSWQ
jgi:nucleotide-binding universal stress UspA family protein